MLLLSTMYFVFCGGADFSQWSSCVSVGGPRLRLLRRTGLIVKSSQKLSGKKHFL
ncbi:hypothetical protein PF003_g12683 [Phytophthora fragariae]|nr:hypothetical protein PF003_g12683 [Phytophthora fragariae]